MKRRHSCENTPELCLLSHINRIWDWQWSIPIFKLYKFAETFTMKIVTAAFYRPGEKFKLKSEISDFFLSQMNLQKVTSIILKK